MSGIRHMVGRTVLIAQQFPIRSLTDSIGISGWVVLQIVRIATRFTIQVSGAAGMILVEAHWQTSAVMVFNSPTELWNSMRAELQTYGILLNKSWSSM